MQSHVGPSPAAFLSQTIFVSTSAALEPFISSSNTRQLYIESKKTQNSWIFFSNEGKWSNVYFTGQSNGNLVYW